MRLFYKKAICADCGLFAEHKNHKITSKNELKRVNKSILNDTQKKLDAYPLKDEFESIEDLSKMLNTKTNETTKLYKEKLNQVYDTIKQQVKTKLQLEIENFNNKIMDRVKALLDTNSNEYAKLQQSYVKSLKKIKVLEQSNQSQNSDDCCSYKKLIEINNELVQDSNQSKTLRNKIETTFNTPITIDVDVDQLLRAIRIIGLDDNIINDSDLLTQTIDETKQTMALPTVDEVLRIKQSLSPIKNSHDENRYQNSFISQLTAHIPITYRCDIKQDNIQEKKRNTLHKRSNTNTNIIMLDVNTSNDRDFDITKYGQNKVLATDRKSPERLDVNNNKKISRYVSVTSRIFKINPKDQGTENLPFNAEKKLNRNISSNNILGIKGKNQIETKPSATEYGGTVCIESQIITDSEMRKFLNIYFCGKKIINKLLFRKNVFVCDPLAVLASFFDSPLKIFILVDMQNNRFETELRTQLKDKKKLLYNRVKVIL